MIGLKVDVDVVNGGIDVSTQPPCVDARCTDVDNVGCGCSASSEGVSGVGDPCRSVEVEDIHDGLLPMLLWQRFCHFRWSWWKSR